MRSISMSRVFRWFIISGIVLVILVLVATFVALLFVYVFRSSNTIGSPLSFPNINCSSRFCGCPNRFGNESLISRIVGGKETSPYLYPWLVALTDRSRLMPFCSGFAISSNVILTAAHCLINRQSSRVQILSKLHDLRDFRGDRHDIDRWLIHDDYHHNDSRHLNDIALIYLAQPLANDIRPCCLPLQRSSTYPRARTISVVSGWGKISTKPVSRSSPILQHVVMPIVDYRNTHCRRSIADTKRQLCAGYDDRSIDACAGDSGAPLLVVESNEYFVAAGIVSYGNEQCDTSISSGVYTRLSYYVDWIDQHGLKTFENEHNITIV